MKTYTAKTLDEALKNIAERYDGYGNSIRRVMEQKDTETGIIGVVSDLIHVDKKYEVAIETALGGNIQNIVTKDEATAKKMNLGVSYNDFNPATGAKKVPGVLFDFADVGGATGINEVVNQSTKLNDGKYYTLSGQQVEKPTAGGIYIHNGKKYIVK